MSDAGIGELLAPLDGPGSHFACDGAEVRSEEWILLVIKDRPYDHLRYRQQHDAVVALLADLLDRSVNA